MSAEPVRPERAYSPAARASDAADPSRVLVIGCGALARELVAVIDQAGLNNVDLTCLPATLHNRPGGIPAAVRAKVRAARPRYERIFIAYADCGTGGLLDAMLADEGVERLPGAHCYEFYAGSATFAGMADEEPGTFYLTDFLARNFDRLVWVGLGLDRHPELLATYFGNYRRLTYLAQTDDPGLVRAARRAARRLGLAFELRKTGYGDLATTLVQAAGIASPPAGRPKAPGERPRTDSRAPDANLAPGARKVADEGAWRADRADSLHPAQRTGPNATRLGEFLPTRQESRFDGPARRRYVHPVQRATPDLPPAQGSGQRAPDEGLGPIVGSAPGSTTSGPA
jgi:hypothetical protein